MEPIHRGLERAAFTLNCLVSTDTVCQVFFTAGSGMPTTQQHEWMQRIFGVKGGLGGSAATEDADAPDDDLLDAEVSVAKSAGSAYVDFSIGEVQGAAKVILPMAEQAAAVSQDLLNPAQAISDASDAAVRLAMDQQYRDAAIAKAESVGATVLGVAQVAARADQIGTDLLVNPVQGAQEVASAASDGAEELGQVYDRVATGYQDAAAKGDGAQYVGNIVGQVGAMVGMAVVGAPEAATDELAVEGLGAAADSGGLAAGGELPALAEDAGAADDALSDAAAADDSAPGEVASGDAEPSSDDAERESRGAARQNGDATEIDGPAADDGAQSGDALAADDPDAETQEGAAVDDGAQSGDALAADDPGAETQEGAAVDDATAPLDGPPADVDIDAVVGKASDKVQGLAEEDLAALPTDEKNQLIKELTLNGKPSGEAQEALRKVYRSMDLDPTFRVKDDARIQDVADSLAGDEDLKAAQQNWDDLEPADRVDALKKVLDAQCKAYGIKSPPIETFEEPMTSDGIVKNGAFDGGKIRLNTHPDAALNDFDSAVDLIAHENAHNYQDQLIERLEKGELKPGDDEYEQATMFAANDRPGAYIKADGAADMQDYSMQPMEQHAFRTGQKLSDAIADVL